MSVVATFDLPGVSSSRRSGVLVPLADALDETSAGGKACMLARLLALDAPVPQGVVLTCEAFDAFLDSSSMRDQIQAQLASLNDRNDPLEMQRVSSAIHALVTSAPLPRNVDEALTSVFASPLGLGLLAVRSSAVGEDGSRFSFAGQFDSVLHVRGIDALRRAVRACWASYWSARALFYRHAQALPSSGIAVVIQRQVDAVVAGVLFTVDPDDNAGSAGPGLRSETAGAMVIEYVAGLADRLVAGEVDPRRVYISRSTCAIERVIASETDALTGPVLTEAQLQDLGRTAMHLEKALGGPQDIEWTIDAAGHLAVVQSRRITSRTGRLVKPGAMLWTNANVNENFPEPLSPLLYSIASAGYYHYFRNLGLAFGVSRRRLAAMDHALRTIVGVHGTRMYYNLTNIHAVLRMAPFGDRLAEAFNLFVGASETPASAAGSASWQDARRRSAQALELARIALAVAWQFLFLRRRLRSFERTADAFAIRTTHDALQDRSLTDLGTDLAAFVDIRCRRWKDASLCDAAAMVCYALLRRCLARHGFGDATHTRLLRALPGVPSSQPALRLWALSRTIRRREDLCALFAERSPALVLHAVQRDHRFDDFRRDFTNFLTEWGFRSSGELMLTTPTLEERPEPVIALLQQYIQTDGESPEQSMARQAAERRAETSLVLKALAIRAPFQAALIWLLLRSTHTAVACRERARLKQALLYTRCRRVSLRIGDALVRDRRLERPDDVFMLTWQELDELCAGRAMFPRGITSLVETRRRQHASESLLTPPDSFSLSAGAAFTPTSIHRAAPRTGAIDDDPLSGTTACGGCVSGPAAVLAGVHEADRLRRGDVLVTRQTDPGWAPVFCLVSGLVIERGGMLSHGAIIAREFGLPCVVGVKGATSRIPHGAMLTVNADLGTCSVETAR